MELFIFLRMGGEQRHVTIRAVADASSTMAVEPESDRDSSPMARSRKRRERRDASHNDEDDDDIISLNTFDAAEADCFRVDDKERMLAVIEGSFGNLDTFNDAIRGLLAGHVAGNSQLGVV